MKTSDSQQCLLDETSYSTDSNYEKTCDLLCYGKRSSIWQGTAARLYVFFIHILLVAIPIAIFRFPHVFDLERISSQPFDPDLASFLHYRTRTDKGNHKDSSIYSGIPSEDNNNAWNEVIRPIYFNASSAEFTSALPSVDQSAGVKVVDGGFLASLEVYHHLHCLKQLRMWVYKDKFLSASPEADTSHLTKHLGHCIENLRQTITCDPSLQVNFFLWKNNNSTSKILDKPFHPIAQQKKCVDWEAVDAWSRKRQIATSPILIQQSHVE